MDQWGYITHTHNTQRRNHKDVRTTETNKEICMNEKLKIQIENNDKMLSLSKTNQTTLEKVNE